MRVVRMCSTVGICFALMVLVAVLYITGTVPHLWYKGSLVFIVIGGTASLFIRRREVKTVPLQPAKVRVRAAGRDC